MASTINFDGMRLEDACAALDKPVGASRSWLTHNGYRISDGRVRRVRSPAEVQDEIAARLAAAPPSTPCFRCGERGFCRHRPAPSTTHHEGARQHG